MKLYIWSDNGFQDIVSCRDRNEGVFKALVRNDLPPLGRDIATSERGIRSADAYSTPAEDFIVLFGLMDKYR